MSKLQKLLVVVLVSLVLLIVVLANYTDKITGNEPAFTFEVTRIDKNTTEVKIKSTVAKTAEITEYKEYGDSKYDKVLLPYNVKKVSPYGGVYVVGQDNAFFATAFWDKGIVSLVYREYKSGKRSVEFQNKGFESVFYTDDGARSWGEQQPPKSESVTKPARKTYTEKTGIFHVFDKPESFLPGSQLLSFHWGDMLAIRSSIGAVQQMSEDTLEVRIGGENEWNPKGFNHVRVLSSSDNTWRALPISQTTWFTHTVTISGALPQISALQVVAEGIPSSVFPVRAFPRIASAVLKLGKGDEDGLLTILGENLTTPYGRTDLGILNGKQSKRFLIWPNKTVTSEKIVTSFPRSEVSRNALAAVVGADGLVGRPAEIQIVE